MRKGERTGGERWMDGRGYALPAAVRAGVLPLSEINGSQSRRVFSKKQNHYFCVLLLCLEVPVIFSY